LPLHGVFDIIARLAIQNAGGARKHDGLLNNAV
jgi:hypothetical protein